MNILGISAYYHDSAASIVVDGEIIAAAQEERFTRIKQDSNFPSNAISYCLHEANLELGDIDQVFFYDKPILKFERLLETFLAFSPRGFKLFMLSMSSWLKDKFFQKRTLQKELNDIDINKKWNQKVLFCEHHLSHAASAFFASPFDEAVVLTLDGVGEWATSSVAIGKNNELKIIKEIHFPHSIGLLYSAFTYYTGFKVNSGEYKVMGLAPYGEPKYKNIILNNLIDVKDDGSYRLNLKYFDYCSGLTMTNNHFNKLFGKPPRKEGEEIEQFYIDIATSVQAVIEYVILKITRALAKELSIKNLCMAGGVALNCVANGKVQRDVAFENIWIQPAAGDAGGSLGAALCGAYIYNNEVREMNGSDAMKGSFLGPQYSQNEIEQSLSKLGAKFKVLSDNETIDVSAQALAATKVIGWFNGRMEFGARALGGRSILGDPRKGEMQKVMNLKIKYRESFRPFAPSVLIEDAADWFSLSEDSPYMLFVSHLKPSRRIEASEQQADFVGLDKLNIPRSEIPAVTHVDYSARVQTVKKETNPRYHALISRFKEYTGCPVLINTSFNVRGEPIVCSPEDAYRCFMGTEMDVLVCGNCVMYKEEQDESLKLDYKNRFKLD